MLTILLVAISLSLDAFSLAIIYGLQQFDKYRIILLSSITGLFHYIMPVMGNIITLILLKDLDINFNKIIGIIFIVLAVQMSFSIKKEEVLTPLNNFINIIFFALSVSLDSFSVGVGFKAFNNNIYISALAFTFFSALFTFAGLFFGYKISNKFGKIANIIGIIILFILSYYYIVVK